jgi:DNA sulfur modification protein DndC
MLTTLDYNTIELIEKEYVSNELPWSLGYSGGKDSSAMLKLVYNALNNIKTPLKPINVVYCDTGVEIPIVSEFVKKTFVAFKEELKENNLPINISIVEPSLENRFFSKVIGRGYPTPTNKFRWCTDRLRVLPIQAMMNKNQDNIVLVGVRKGESVERDKVIDNHHTDNPYYLKQANFPNAKIFAPIIDYEVNDIWSIIKSNYLPTSIDGEALELIYQHAGEDQIDFKDFASPSIQKGRFGCWTCTVVRKDKAVNNLISNGYNSLIPLLNFRNWLYELRDNKEYRCNWRRNGAKGPGPFTLEAREIILERLLKAQAESNYELIKDNEIDFIRKQWELDKVSTIYKEK